MTAPAGEGDFKDHFSEVAAAYAAHRPTYPAALVDLLARVAPARRLAWDAGCGSGQLSALLAGPFARVWATDASTEQLARATPHHKVTYSCAPAQASGLADGVVDLATAAQAAHWFDLPAYYAEVRRVARPGGIVALISYGVMTVIRGHVVRNLGPYACGGAGAARGVPEGAGPRVGAGRTGPHHPLAARPPRRSGVRRGAGG